MRTTRLPIPSLAMALVVCAAARTGAAEVRELDPDGAEPLSQQVYRSATQPSGDGPRGRRTGPAPTTITR